MAIPLKTIQVNNTQQKNETKKSVPKKFNKNVIVINKLFMYGILAVVLIVSLYLMYSFVNENIKKTDSDLNVLKKYSEKLTNDINELENKARISKKYIEVWDKIPEHKKEANGIQLSNVKDLLDKLTNKHAFRNIKINAETPETLSGEFSREKIRASTSLITINFESLFDYKIYDFLEVVLEELNGFAVIESVNLDRQQKITDSYLIQLSENNNTQLPIKASIKIRLYGLNKK